MQAKKAFADVLDFGAAETAPRRRRAGFGCGFG